jgi:hypothetical protein
VAWKQMAFDFDRFKILFQLFSNLNWKADDVNKSQRKTKYEELPNKENISKQLQKSSETGEDSLKEKKTVFVPNQRGQDNFLPLPPPFSQAIS